MCLRIQENLLSISQKQLSRFPTSVILRIRIISIVDLDPVQAAQLYVVLKVDQLVIFEILIHLAFYLV